LKPSERCKELGLNGLTQMSEMTSQSVQTLNNWFKHKRELFEIVLLGCKLKLLIDLADRPVNKLRQHE